MIGFLGIMKKISVNYLIMTLLKIFSFFLLTSCSNNSETNSARVSENLIEKGTYQLCVEIDGPDPNDNETLKEPNGRYITLSTQPINTETSIFRKEVQKKLFKFFCSPLSNWNFKKVILSRPYPAGIPPVQYRFRWAFHHKPDGADILLTSSWFLAKEEPMNSLSLDQYIVSSDTLSEQIHRLRILEQVTFCYEDGKIIDELNMSICTQLTSQMKKQYPEYEQEIIENSQEIAKFNNE